MDLTRARKAYDGKKTTTPSGIRLITLEMSAPSSRICHISAGFSCLSVFLYETANYQAIVISTVKLEFHRFLARSQGDDLCQKAFFGYDMVTTERSDIFACLCGEQLAEIFHLARGAGKVTLRASSRLETGCALTGAMVPPAKTMLRASCTTLPKCSAGFNKM